MARRRRPPRPGALADLAPFRIFTQILALQASYYGVALILIVFTTVVAGQHPSVGLLFDWHNLRGDVTTGWTLGLCWMLDSLITYVYQHLRRRDTSTNSCGSVIPILLLIARSKLVPDFALTIHFVNLLITSVYTRAIPLNPYWWFIQASSAALMIALGIWACQWRELKPMAFGGAGGARKGKNKEATNGHVPDAEGGEGFVTGSGRGRGRDGAGAYEMVGMNSAREPP